MNNTKNCFKIHDHYILKSTRNYILTITAIYCNLVDIIQDGSHEGDEMKLEVDNYVMENKSNNYISKIYVFQLLEFMNGTLRLMKEIENYTKVNFFKTKNIYNQELTVTLEAPKNGNLEFYFLMSMVYQLKIRT